MQFFKSSKTLTVAVGVSLCGLGGYMLYHYLSSDERQITVKLQVPVSYVGLIIGRGGSRLREIEKSSGALVNFKEAPVAAKECACEITGTKHSCLFAEFMIKSIINDEETCLYEDISIPSYAVGHLIGYSGSTIQEISHQTGVQISVQRKSKDDADNPSEVNRQFQKVTLRGTRQQIDESKEYIQGVIDEARDVKESMDKRQPRKPAQVKERLGNYAVVGSAPFEVYVSAMIDPSRFWIQIVGPKAQQLDLLVEEMTEYYRVPQHRELTKIASVEEGDLVAATFLYDERWYRAEVLEISPDGELVELYYVDYGDTERVATAELCQLKVNFLELHFQAIECFLANVDPVGGVWASEAVDKFEEWAHVAHWRKLSAKLSNYSFRDRSRAKRSSSPVPGIELIDVVNDADINIGDELVRQGYAVYALNEDSDSSIDWDRCTFRPRNGIGLTLEREIVKQLRNYDVAVVKVLLQLISVGTSREAREYKRIMNMWKRV